MDINDQIQPVVTSLLDNLKISLENELRDQVTEEVVRKVTANEVKSIVENLVGRWLTDKLDSYDFETLIKTRLDVAVNQLSTQVNNGIAKTASSQITEQINKRIAAFDLTDVVNSIVETKLSEMVRTHRFPNSSIPHASVDFQGIKLSGAVLV
jgi:uncharacterized membrane-anchored protein YjiN (DUF445 family)